MGLPQDFTVNDQKLAKIVFKGIFEHSEEKRKAFIQKCQDIVLGNPSEKINLGLRSQYSRVGDSITSFHFIDPENHRISEVMVDIIPVDGHQDKFSDMFARTVNDAITQPSKNRENTPPPQKPVMS